MRIGGARNGLTWARLERGAEGLENCLSPQREGG